MSCKRKELIFSRVRELTRIIESTQLHRGPSNFSHSKLEEDVCWIPRIKAIITGGSAEEFSELKAGLADRLPALAAESKEARSAALLPLLPHENPSMEKLSLATTWFKCERSWCPALQPKLALVHNCFKQTDSDVSEPDRNYVDSVGKPWGIGQGASFYETAAEFARELILAIGGDPETMTHEEMDNQGCRFVRDHGNDATIESFDSMVRPIPSALGFISVFFLTAEAIGPGLSQWVWGTTESVDCVNARRNIWTHIAVGAPDVPKPGLRALPGIEHSET